MTPTDRVRPVGELVRRRRRWAAIGALVAFATVVSIHAAVAANQVVSITDTGYQPGEITVTQGEVVSWTQRGKLTHTVTADDGSFDSGVLQPGGFFDHAFVTAGVFTYHCTLHDMTGRVVVVAVVASPSGPTAAPTPTPTPARTPAPVPSAAPGATSAPSPSSTPSASVLPEGSGSTDGASISPVAIVAGLVAVALLVIALLFVVPFPGRRDQDGTA